MQQDKRLIIPNMIDDPFIKQVCLWGKGKCNDDA